MTRHGAIEPVADQRGIIDRRAIADAIAADPDRAPALLEAALGHGRQVIAERFAARPGDGRSAASAYAFLHAQIVRLAFDHVTAHLYPNHNPSKGERIALVGLGGTGRAEQAPYSDLDLLLVVGGHVPWCEQVAEALLYLLWDLQLKIGQSVRTLDEAIAAAHGDMTIRTAMIDARWLWGDRALVDQLRARFETELVATGADQFVAAKLAERDERHLKMGDSRYLVEPNVKDGKGGLRDLHTLLWIARYALGVEQSRDLVTKGLLTPAEYARFDRATRFFWAVRCHLHLAAGRAEERLGFEYQPQIAAAMRYSDRPGKSAVERFMHFYFLQAKAVGDLTGQFLATLDDRLAKRGRRFALPTLARRRPARLDGFILDRGRLSIPGTDYLAADPVRLIALFAVAARERLEIHPHAMREATRLARLADSVRDDPAANAMFLEVLTDRQAPDLVLRWMNEAGVFGRFVPDFGRVVAQMQFDMYHHYTVDEHSIRAIGLLAAIERGDLVDDHPLATALMRQIGSRRTLYVAVLLHDIAKGRGGDHSEIGAEIAASLCPRFGLDSAETETVVWLVRHHLLMSRVAFRRDIADPKTIDDFVREVQSPERLRLLLVLTVVDIRAVGPGTWSDWKRTLLRSLFDAAEERLRLGHKQRGRSDLVASRQQALAARLDWNRSQLRAHFRRLPDSYWLAEPTDWQVANARHVAEAEASFASSPTSVIAEDDPQSGATRLTLFTADQPGLFRRIAAALAKAGANIIEARIHTTRDGFALDNLLLHNRQGRPYRDLSRRRKLAEAVRAAIATQAVADPPRPPALELRETPFDVAPRVVVAPGASTRFTVVEVNARDRPGLLARLAAAINDSGAALQSAHVATYGERAVDVFYLAGADGRKLKSDQLDQLRSALLEAARDAQ